LVTPILTILHKVIAILTSSKLSSWQGRGGKRGTWAQSLRASGAIHVNEGGGERMYYLIGIILYV